MYDPHVHDYRTMREFPVKTSASAYTWDTGANPFGKLILKFGFFY